MYLKDPIVFNTNGGNRFLFSPFRKQFILCHPVVQCLFELHQKDADILQFLDKIKQVGYLDVKDFGRFSQDEVSYHYRKFRFLLSNGYFKPMPLPKMNGRLNPLKIDDNLKHIRQIILEVTEDCNLSCIYCSYSKFYINEPRSNASLSFTAARKMISWVLHQRENDTNQELIISFYGGEPLKNYALIRRVVQFVDKSNKYGIHVKYNMTSNGTLVKKYFSFLEQYGFSVTISLDGDRYANSFRVFRETGKQVYDAVLKNILYIRNTNPEYYEKNISFLAVLHKRNSSEEVHRFFKDEFGKIPTLTDVSTINLRPGKRSKFFQTFIDSRKPRISSMSEAKDMMTFHPEIKGLSDMLEHTLAFFYRSYLQLASGKASLHIPRAIIPTATCSPFNIRMFLTVDGRILPCEHISRSYWIGRLTSGQPEMNIRKIANSFNSYLEKISPLCSKCYISDACKECMFNIHLKEQPPRCDYFIDKKTWPAFLAWRMSILERDPTIYPKIMRKGNDK